METGAKGDRCTRRIHHEVLRRAGKPSRIQCGIGSQYAADVLPYVRYPAVPVQELSQTYRHPADAPSHLYRHRTGLLLLGKTFDFFAILGLLGLIGMNIKNAIVLVDQIDAETAMGKTPREAVISATTTRIVPVAMASGTTILGMLPLLFDAMFGGMAATIMGGLLVASILTLFVLPVAYCAIHKIKG